MIMKKIQCITEKIRLDLSPEESDAIRNIGKMNRSFRFCEGSVTMDNDLVYGTLGGYMIPVEDCPDRKALREELAPLERQAEKFPGGHLVFDILGGFWFVRIVTEEIKSPRCGKETEDENRSARYK